MYYGMIGIFVDIETYSPHVSSPRLCDKVISIAYKIGDSDVVVLKEWELSERTRARALSLNVAWSSVFCYR